MEYNVGYYVKINTAYTQRKVRRAKALEEKEKSMAQEIVHGPSINFNLDQTTPIEIIEVTKLLKNKTAKGEDEIPLSIIQDCIELIAEPLSFIFNNSLKSGKFPHTFKNAIILPLFKKGQRYLLQNYRPISLLNTLSKVLEKLMHKRLLNHVQKFNLCNVQFGFVDDRSISDAISNFLSELYLNIYQSKAAIGIFCDLSKAFDCVGHGHLIQKLRSYGITGTALSWFSSYLDGRTQQVSVETLDSDGVSECIVNKKGIEKGRAPRKYIRTTTIPVIHKRYKNMF